jgi:hypothetical protein
MTLVKGMTLVGLLTASSVFAATSGTLLLKGSVPAVLSITVSPETLASTLPLDATLVDSKVATVNEASNSNTGYQVSISSANQGQLVHESVVSSSINYSLKYDGSAVNLATGESFAFSTAASVNINKDLNISYTGVSHENLIQGDYADTVTLTISAD